MLLNQAEWPGTQGDILAMAAKVLCVEGEGEGARTVVVWIYVLSSRSVMPGSDPASNGLASSKQIAILLPR